MLSRSAKAVEQYQTSNKKITELEQKMTQANSGVLTQLPSVSVNIDLSELIEYTKAQIQYQGCIRKTLTAFTIDAIKPQQKATHSSSISLAEDGRTIANLTIDSFTQDVFIIVRGTIMPALDIILQEYTLDQIKQDLKQICKKSPLIPENYQNFTLKACFTESTGYNLRNNVAHGLLSDESSASGGCVYSWWFILRWLLKS